MRLIDSHCHLDRIDYEKINSSLAEIVQKAELADVKYMLCVGIALRTFPGMQKRMKEFSNVFLSVGIHPGDDEVLMPDFVQLEQYARGEKVVAIGEMGLDYHYGKDRIQEQCFAFESQIEIAKKIGKPIIVHTREAQNDTLSIMRSAGAEQIGGVMHCFTEDWEMAKQALDLGFYISFSGIVTFNNATELQEVCKKVPLDRLLIETDSPYLAPKPYRGKINQPAYLQEVAQKIADLRQISLDNLAEKTSENFAKLFSITF